MNVVIMCQVHHQSIEMVDENLQIVLKSTPMDTKQAYPTQQLQYVKNVMKIQADFLQL